MIAFESSLQDDPTKPSIGLIIASTVLLGIAIVPLFRTTFTLLGRLLDIAQAPSTRDKMAKTLLDFVFIGIRFFHTQVRLQLLANVQALTTGLFLVRFQASNSLLGAPELVRSGIGSCLNSRRSSGAVLSLRRAASHRRGEATPTRGFSAAASKALSMNSSARRADGLSVSARDRNTSQDCLGIGALT